MPPPPVPWFRGRTVVVSEANGLLAFKPVGRHTFTSPHGTLELYLPSATLAVAVAEGSALGFQGDFTRVDRPDDVVLAPVDPGDAEQIEQVLAQQLGLPLIPRATTPAQLRGSEQIQFVTVEGVFLPGHVEYANFEGMMLNRRDLVRGARYRVMGFYRPGRQHDEPPHVGYNGPRLHALAVTLLPSG